MKKINWKNVAKGIVLSPVYAAGFCYGIGKHVADKINSKQTVNVNVVPDSINDAIEHIEHNSPFATVAMNGAVTVASRTIYDNPRNMAILTGKEDTL